MNNDGAFNVQQLRPTVINQDIKISSPHFVHSSQGTPSAPKVVSLSSPQFLSVSRPRFVQNSNAQIVGVSAHQVRQSKKINTNGSRVQSFKPTHFHGTVDFSNVNQPQILSASQPEIKPQMIKVSQNKAR